MVFGAYLPSTQQKHLRGAQVPPQRAFSICPQGLATAHCSSHPREELPEHFSSRFLLFCKKYFPEQPQRPGHPGDLHVGKRQPGLPPNEHEIWAESLPKPRAEKDRRQPGECASINKFYGNPQLLCSCGVSMNLDSYCGMLRAGWDHPTPCICTSCF